MKKTGKFKKISFIIFIIAMLLLSIISIPLVNGIGDKEAITQFKDRFEIWSFFILLIIQILQIIVALIPGELLEFVSGVVFGPFWGMALCMIGIFLGQFLIFKIVTIWGKDFLDQVLDSKAIQRLGFLKNEKRIYTITFLLYLIPGTPKDLITYFMPITGIGLKRFLTISMVARIPSVLSSTWAGATYAENDFKTLIIIYGVVLIASGIGYLAYKKIISIRQKISNKKEQTNTGEV